MNTLLITLFLIALAIAAGKLLYHLTSAIGGWIDGALVARRRRRLERLANNQRLQRLAGLGGLKITRAEMLRRVDAVGENLHRAARDI